MVVMLRLQHHVNSLAINERKALQWGQFVTLQAFRITENMAFADRLYD